MEDRRQQQTPSYNLDLFADRIHARDVATAVLHLIFFHRVFSTISPSTLDVLDLTLPRVIDNDLGALIDQRVNDLLRQLDVEVGGGGGYAGGGGTGGGGIGAGAGGGGGRGQIAIHFSEKKRRKGWFGNANDEEMVWESWLVSLTLASPRTESGEFLLRSHKPANSDKIRGGLSVLY